MTRLDSLWAAARQGNAFLAVMPFSEI